MLVPLFPLLWLFFCYSFLGWVLETAVSAVRLHRYVDRSVLFGPLCACYGITAVLLTVGLPELRGNYFFLFLGSAICSTVVEWIAGHLLEKATHTRWWDYSNRRGNLDGYICVGAFLLWGVLGLAAVQWINPLLLALYRWLPPLVGEILLWVLLALLAADIAGTVLTLCGVRSSLPPLENLNSRLAALSVRLGEWILRRAEGRIQKAHPGAVFSRRRERTTVSPFARGASFYSILLLFFIGGVAGDLAETIFCRLKMGWWMSRSSVVWGPFSIVWGLALAAATLFLYKYRDRSASLFFEAGTLLGLQRYSLQPGRAHQPAVLLLLGLRRGGLVPGALPHPGPLDRQDSTAPRESGGLAAHRLHVRQYGGQRPGPGTLQRPGRRRARRRGLGAVHGCPLR